MSLSNKKGWKKIELKADYIPPLTRIITCILFED